MTNLEYGLEKGLINWQVNELFGHVTITIKDVYPKNDDDIKEIINFLNKEDNK